MKNVVILGSTGSIGVQTLAIARRFPDRVKVIGIAARRAEVLAQQAAEFQVPVAVVAGDAADVVTFPTHTTVLYGADAMRDLACLPDADMVVVATVGRAGLLGTLAALGAGKRVLLANKEVLVMAGQLARRTLATGGGVLVPVDSEHSALWQCLLGEDPAAVETLMLTASGGALRNRPLSALADVTAQEALKHPNWTMGPKVTIDSASLMNKGMEVIEAHWLFDVPYERIRVVIHPTSVVHSLVQFVDGAIKAQLGITDMRLPIQFALSYPERWENEDLKVDLLGLGELRFSEPEWDRYPCLQLALSAGKAGGTYPAVLSGADEIAVDRFIAGAIAFTAIPRVISRVLELHRNVADPGLDDILAADEWARATCRSLAR